MLLPVKSGARDGDVAGDEDDDEGCEAGRREHARAGSSPTLGSRARRQASRTAASR